MELSTEQIQQQLDLEFESVQLGAAAYRETLSKARSNHDRVEGFVPERVILNEYIQTMLDGTPTVEGLTRFMKVPRRVGNGVVVRKYLKEHDPLEIAFLALKVFINHLHKKELKMYNLAVSLGQAVCDHINYLKFKEADSKYVANILQYTRMSGAGHRRATIKTLANRTPATKFTPWDTDTCHAVGHKLLDLLIHTTGIATLGQLPGTKRKQGAYILVVRPDLVAALEAAHETHAMNHPLHFPMVIPPNPWTATTSGGHLSQISMPRYRMIGRNRSNRRGDSVVTNVEPIRSAINHLQGVSWRVNQPILDVITKVSHLRTGLAGTPIVDKDVLLDEVVVPWANNEERTALKHNDPVRYRRVMKLLQTKHDLWARSVSKRSGFAKQLLISRKLAGAPLWFCYTADWRGRINCLQSHMSPQSNDIGKGLIEFNEGKPLGDAEGPFWFTIHGPGCFAERTPELNNAIDKYGFDERLAWVDRHLADILDSGTNPLDGDGFWLQADKPIQFLAWCMEYARYVQGGYQTTFVSHLPVALDGTCSGLQHMSAAWRDDECAAWVNLMSSDDPQDIYRRVADVASPLVDADVAAGVQYADLWAGKVDRSVTKKAVMTMVYGAKARTYTQQLVGFLTKHIEKGHPYIEVSSEELWKACSYLKGHIVTAMRAVIRKATEAMEWFRAVASLVGKQNQSLWWTTTDGVKVYQTYHNMDSTRIFTYWGDFIFQPRKNTPNDTIDIASMRDGLSPNWTHSYDACHLRTAINTFMSVPGSSLSVVHDSFGAHACDTERLSQTLRSTFRAQYEVDNVARLVAELTAQFPDIEFPPPPTPGTWDPACMEGAVYSFV